MAETKGLTGFVSLAVTENTATFRCRHVAGGWKVRIPKGEIKMQKLSKFVVEFVKREDGPTAVEYAVMLALIIVVCITAITTLGSNANKTFTSVGTAVGGASS